MAQRQVDLERMLEGVRGVFRHPKVPVTAIRRKTLLYRQNQDRKDHTLVPVFTWAEAVVSPSEPILLDYGQWILEDENLDETKSVEWLESAWKRLTWRLQSGETVHFDHVPNPMYDQTRVVPLRPNREPCHWYVTRLALKVAYDEGPLVRSGLPAFPGWRYLAQEMFGIEDRAQGWEGEIHVVLPLTSTRIEFVRFGGRKARVRVWSAASDFTGMGFRLWALDASGRAMQAYTDSVKSEFTVTVPRQPARAVGFLLDIQTEQVIDQWGEPWMVLQPRSPRTLAAALADRILNGESQDLELKNYVHRRTPSGEMDPSYLNRDKLARTLVAFANSNDGLIVLGVDDNLEIRGVSDYRRTRDVVMEVAHDQCKPPLTPRITKVVMQGRTLACVEVRQSSRLHQTQEYVSYTRRGSSVRKMSPSEVEDHARSRGPLKW